MKISVILTTCDRPEYLQEAIASYRAQDYLDSECIIINDGKAALPSEVEKDSRIRTYTTCGPYKGQAFAINSGAKLAKGDLIVWLCDDDLFSDHESLSKRASLFRREANTEFVATGWTIIDAQGEPTGEQYTPPPMRPWLSLNTETINLAAAMWKRSLHERLGGFNENLKYYVDWDWKIRIGMEGECLTSDIVTSRYRVHSGQAGVRRRAEGADAEETRKMRSSIEARYGRTLW